jgi:hypothetical protein
MKMIHIRVKEIFTAVQGQVPGKMYGQKTAEAQTGNRHHQLFPDTSPQRVCRQVHRILQHVELIINL